MDFDKDAKKNRQAVSGIFVLANGCEPVEFGNFKRIDNDFYCTVDKAALAEGGPLLFLWAAYELARVQAVTAVGKEAGGKLDLERIQRQIDGIAAWVPRLGRPHHAPPVSKALELELAPFHPIVDPLSVSPPGRSETHLSSCRCRSR